PNCTVSPTAASKLMIRPVILSRPENIAPLLAIFCDGGSGMTSSPGCGEVSAGCGVPRGGRTPGGGKPPGGKAPGGKAATGGQAGPGTTAALPPGGGGSGCVWTPAPDGPLVSSKYPPWRGSW